MAEQSLLDEFLSESREHLERVEQDFIHLEKGSTDPEVINRIFRAVHTVKGSSGFFGLERIGSLAHALESVLDRMRDHAISPTPDILDHLLKGLDVLNALLGDVSHSNEQNTKEIEDKILSCIHPSKVSSCTVLSEDVKHSKPWETSDINWEKVPKSHLLYRLDFDLQAMEEKHGISPVSLIDNLQTLGLVHDGFLQSPHLDPCGDDFISQVTFQLLFSTVLELDLVGQATHLDANQIHLIQAPIQTQSQTEQPATTLNYSQEHKCVEPDSIKVKVGILDRLMQLAGELVLVRNQQLLLAEADGSTASGITNRLDIVTSALQETIMRTRMQPIGNIFSRFERIVRDLGRKLGKEIILETDGNDVELDKNILDALADPLTHLIRNSCDHGIESPEVRQSNGKSIQGKIHLRAYHEGGQVHVDISDDGKGIHRNDVFKKALESGLRTKEELQNLTDSELISLILLPGFSTAKEVSDISGRGVGMDVVKTSIERLGGIIEIESEEGAGTNIHMRLPLTLAIIPCMVVEAIGQRFAIPQIDLEELVCLYDKDILTRVECAGTREVFRLRDSLLTLIRLEEVLHRQTPFNEDTKRIITEEWRLRRKKQFEESSNIKLSNSCSLNFAVLKVGADRFGLIIDKIIGTEEIVVKPMHRAVKDLSIYTGATVLGDGSVAMILDVLGISRHTTLRFDSIKSAPVSECKENDQETRKLMLFNYGKCEQMAVPMEKIRRIERIAMEKVDRIGQKEFFMVGNQSTRLLRLDMLLDIEQGNPLEEMFLLLPKNPRIPYGILVSQLLDVGDYKYKLDQQSIHTRGVEGTLLINERMTMLIEPDTIFNLVEQDYPQEVSFA